MVTVARDGAGDIKEDKWLGVNELETEGRNFNN
jgi:hypothetical protein